MSYLLQPTLRSTDSHTIFRRLMPALALMTLLSACSQGPSSANNAPPGGSPTEVVVLDMKPKDINVEQEYPGRILAFQTAQVRPQVSGIIEKRLFNEGGFVSKGQALYQIDDAPYRAALDSAKANVEKAKSAVQTASLKWQRMKTLVESRAVSQQELEDSQNALNAAQADLAAAQAQAKTAQINLNYTRITAPISGQISRSTVTAGALVQNGQASELATISQIDPILVDLNQSTAEWLELKRKGLLAKRGNATLQLTLENGAIYPHLGRLEFAETAVDPNTGTVRLRAIFPNPEKTLLPGMYAKVNIPLGQSKSAYSVPQLAVLRDAKGGASVLVLNSEGLVEQRAVKVSKANQNEWIIDEGIAQGDKVIVEGLQKVKPGKLAVEKKAG